MTRGRHSLILRSVTRYTSIPPPYGSGISRPQSAYMLVTLGNAFKAFLCASVMQTTANASSIIFSVSLREENVSEKGIFASASACALFGEIALPSSACNPADKTVYHLILRRFSSCRKAASAMGERQVFPVQTKMIFLCFIYSPRQARVNRLSTPSITPPLPFGSTAIMSVYPSSPRCRQS